MHYIYKYNFTCENMKMRYKLQKSYLTHAAATLKKFATQPLKGKLTVPFTTNLSQFNSLAI